MEILFQIKIDRSIATTISCWLRRCLLLFSVISSLQAAQTKEKSAELDIDGYGFFGNRELKRMLTLLETDEKKPDFYDANFVEDSVLLLFSRLNRDGFLNPSIKATLFMEDGTQQAYSWESPIADPLPRALRIQKVSFEIHKGVLYHFDEIQFSGLTALDEKRARSFFIETGTLFPLKSYRIYSTNRVNTGISSLVEALQRKGYESAGAAATEVSKNNATGAVTMLVDVKQGLRSDVRSIRIETSAAPSADLPKNVTVEHPTNVFSDVWLQDFTQSLRATNYHKGYPDTKVEVSTQGRETTNDVIKVDLLANVYTGNQVRIRKIDFVGEEKTKESVMKRRIDLDEGDLLNRALAEQGRYKLARLGIFDSVELAYTPVDETTRDVTYRVREGREIDMSLLFGYGSYEMLRLGFEIEQFNVFGRAHRSRLRAVQSFRSTSAEYRYTMPAFLGEEVDVFVNASGLRREEIAFTREEFGGGAGISRNFTSISTDTSLRYNYEILNATDTDFGLPQFVRKAAVGALIGDLRHDRRDNPLYPHSGYKIFSTLELASEYLAGDVNFQRLEVAGSYHQPLDEGRWLHFGVSHGVVVTLDGPENDLPFNRRFFPGGESSIRGYQQGEAAPRNADGDILGAEVYVGSNIEFEQALTPAWSVVTFIDTMGFAESVKDYPFNEFLVSVGAGLRWKTIIGPVRLEYGYNLNPREDDPTGTLHFSIGFPF